MDDFFSEETFPFSPRSTSSSRHGDNTQVMQDTDHDLSAETPSTVTMTDVQKNQSRSNIDDITSRMQALVEKINDGRTKGQKMVDSFHGKLTEKVTEASQQMKENMFMVYEENSQHMQVELQELSKVLEKCTTLSNELEEARRALSSLKEGFNIHDPESESS